jgi:RHS repeat-associated protein
VRQVTDGSGLVTLQQSYDPFGNLLTSTSSTLTAYGFTGEWADSSGLEYLRARYYDPSLGIFTSRDPVRGTLTEPMTLNPYSYAVNDPLRYTDPSGEFIVAFPASRRGVCLVSAYLLSNELTNYPH